VYQVTGPITTRLLAQHGPTSDGWSPGRDAGHVTAMPAGGCMWPLCGRETTPAGGVDRRTHRSSRPGTRAA